MKRKDTERHLEPIPIDEAATIPELFSTRIKRSPHAIAYQQYDQQRQKWMDYSWADMANRVARWQLALSREALQQGERVAVMLPNNIEFICFDQAALSLGLVVISLYITDTADNIAYILNDSDARLVLVNNESDWKGLEEHHQSLPQLKRVLCLQTTDSDKRTDKQIAFVEEWLPGEAALLPGKVTDPHALATLIYTSGTTGRPKGVMLSHYNILWNAEAVIKHIPVYREDVFLSFLPMAHSFERTVEYYMSMMAGSRVAFCRSIEQLAEDLSVIRPSVLLSPPRIYEKIYAALLEKTASSKLESMLLTWTVALGWKQFEADQGRARQPGSLSGLALRVLHALVSKKVLAKLGGRIRVAVTGAAPLSQEITRFFLGLGLPLIEGYGLTEAAPTVCANRLQDNYPGSVGRVLPGVEVRIADKGELLVRSPSVMQGYWKHEEKTHKTIDSEGWLHTGDIAQIDQGRIFIRGRLKEVIVTSTGEKVAPADMEMSITMDPLFEQAMVVGEGKPFLGALLILNQRNWEAFASARAVLATDPKALQSSLIKEDILAMLAVSLKRFPGYAQIHAVHLDLEPWSIDNGLLTPTLKIKRTEIERRFASEINQLYRGHKLVD